MTEQPSTKAESKKRKASSKGDSERKPKKARKRRRLFSTKKKTRKTPPKQAKVIAAQDNDPDGDDGEGTSGFKWCKCDMYIVVKPIGSSESGPDVCDLCGGIVRD